MRRSPATRSLRSKKAAHGPPVALRRGLDYRPDRGCVSARAAAGVCARHCVPDGCRGCQSRRRSRPRRAAIDARMSGCRSSSRPGRAADAQLRAYRGSRSTAARCSSGDWGSCPAAVSDRTPMDRREVPNFRHDDIAGVGGRAIVFDANRRWPPGHVGRWSNGPGRGDPRSLPGEAVTGVGDDVGAAVMAGSYHGRRPPWAALRAALRRRSDLC